MDLLSNEICEKILLNSHSKNQAPSAYKLISFSLKPISDQTEGYLGSHYNLEINYFEDKKLETKTKIFFLKNRTTNNKFQEKVAGESNAYKKEVFIYDILFKKFEDLDYDTRFFAKSVYCVPDQMIVMENLKLKGYDLLDRSTKFTLEQIKSSLRALALFHGSGFALEKTKSAQIGKIYKLTDDYSLELRENYFRQLIDDSKLNRDFWVGVKKTIITLLQLLPMDQDRKNNFQFLFEKHEIGKIFADETDFAKTVSHGDLWSNNMMFKASKNGDYECCLVDYQFIRYFYPSYDVALVIWCNTNNEFRKTHLKELCEYYYSYLTKVLTTYSCDVQDILPKSEYYQTLELVLIDVLIQCCFIYSVVYIPQDIISKQQFDSDNGFEEIIFGNFKLAKIAFNDDSFYRNKLTNILNELEKALTQRQ